MSTVVKNPTKVITGPKTRWSYANVWDPKSINGGAPKYSVSLIIPKSDTQTVEKIKAAIQAAYEEGQSKLKGNGKSVPALDLIKTPLRDGDRERPDDPTYAGCYFINANSATAPGIVDADRQPILERSEVYSVCMAGLPSTFMLSIATEIRESPAVSITFRRFPMASLLVVSPEPRTISHPMMMTNSSTNHKYKSHFNLLWGGGAKLPPYFITERKIYERIVNRFRNI